MFVSDCSSCFSFELLIYLYVFVSASAVIVGDLLVLVEECFEVLLRLVPNLAVKVGGETDLAIIKGAFG